METLKQWISEREGKMIEIVTIQAGTSRVKVQKVHFVIVIPQNAKERVKYDLMEDLAMLCMCEGMTIGTCYSHKGIGVNGRCVECIVYIKI